MGFGMSQVGSSTSDGGIIMKRAKKGFTLTEIIVTIMIMGMLWLVIASVFRTTLQGQELIDREAAIQADMRTTMLSVDRAVQDATAVFILDDQKYVSQEKKFTKGWNYIGLSDDKKYVLQFLWNQTSQTWHKRVMSRSLYDVSYDLNFVPQDDYQDNRLVNYSLAGQYADGGHKIVAHSAISSLNSKQIFSKVGTSKKGIAIAYRNDEIDEAVDVSISFVMDTSASMGRPMRRGSNDPTRISILKAQAKEMIHNLATIGGVRVNLVGFGSRATYIEKNYINVGENKTSILNAIDVLRPAGETNPGDGLRYSLTSLANEKVQLRYVVLLTDGAPTQSTFYARGSYLYYDLSDPNLPSQYRTIYRTEKTPIEYARQVSEKYAAGVRRINVIGFSGDVADKRLGQDLTNAIQNRLVDAKYFDAASSEELKAVFEEIKMQIGEDMWFIVGP